MPELIPRELTGNPGLVGQALILLQIRTAAVLVKQEERCSAILISNLIWGQMPLYPFSLIRIWLDPTKGWMAFGDQTKDATLGEHGLSVTQGGKTYEGVWDTNKGENGTVTVAGTGALKGYSADVTGKCGGNCVAEGVVKSPGNGSANITQSLFKVLDTNSSGHVKEAGTDGINFFHPGATNFRGHKDGDPTGIPSTHIPIDPRASTPRVGFQVDSVFPYDSMGDFLEHAGCASNTICNPQK